MLDRLAGLSGQAWTVAVGLVLAGVLAADVHRVAVAGGDWGFTLAAGVVVSGAALLWGMGPLRAAIGGIAADGLTILLSGVTPLDAGHPAAVVIALLVLGATAMRGLSGWPAVVVGLAGSAVIVAAPLVEVHGTARSGEALASLFAWWVALAVGLWLRWRDDRRLSALEAVRQEERLQLARELHDVVAHHVTGIVVQSQAARLVADRRPEIVASTLAAVEVAGGEALSAMRRLVGLLRDPGDAASTSPGAGELRALIEGFAPHGPVVELELADGVPSPAWPPEVATTVYRVVQESLTNVSRHAHGAHQVGVRVAVRDHTVVVEVTDDGATAGPRHAVVGTGSVMGAGAVYGLGTGSVMGAGYGLVGMRERVEALGGRLDAGRGSTGGWQVQATLPLPGWDRA
ncbi:MAG: sensor histidine kinase [Acidimicrobiales bacterium]